MEVGGWVGEWVGCESVGHVMNMRDGRFSSPSSHPPLVRISSPERTPALRWTRRLSGARARAPPCPRPRRRPSRRGMRPCSTIRTKELSWIGEGEEEEGASPSTADTGGGGGGGQAPVDAGGGGDGDGALAGGEHRQRQRRWGWRGGGGCDAGCR